MATVNRQQVKLISTLGADETTLDRYERLSQRRYERRISENLEKRLLAAAAESVEKSKTNVIDGSHW